MEPPDRNSGPRIIGRMVVHYDKHTCHIVGGAKQAPSITDCREKRAPAAHRVSGKLGAWKVFIALSDCSSMSRKVRNVTKGQDGEANRTAGVIRGNRGSVHSYLLPLRGNPSAIACSVSLDTKSVFASAYSC